MDGNLNGPKRFHWAAWAFSLVLFFAAAPTTAGVLSTSDVLSRTGQSIEAWGGDLVAMGVCSS